MSARDWPGEERRRPPLTSPTWAVRAPLAAWLQEHAAAGERVPRPRCRLRPEALLPLLRGAGERVRRRRRRREPGRRAASAASRTFPSSDGELRSRPLHAGARALRRPGAGGARAAARDRPRRPRARVDARDAGATTPRRQDYWRWTHAGLSAARSSEQAEWESVAVAPGRRHRDDASRCSLGTYIEIALPSDSAGEAAGLAPEPARRRALDRPFAAAGRAASRAR